MRLGVLGPLEIVGPHGSVPVTGPKRRALLALFIVHRGQTLPIARIVDLLWEEGANDGALGTVRTYVSQLRRLFDGDDGVELLTKPSGYALSVGRDVVDVDAFETALHAAASQADLHERAAALDRALGSWRGAPLEEFAYEWASVERTRLERLRIDALGDRAEVRLQLGDHRVALGELEAVTREHPYEERLWGQRMLAAYRDGRQTEALRAFRTVQNLFRDELGINPGPELIELERRILDQDPTLQLTFAPPTVTALPTGVVTLLLTDVEKSTTLWDANPDEMSQALAQHDALIASTISEHKGTLLKARGEGDSTFSVFSRASDAIVASLALTRLLSTHTWPGGLEVRDRMAICTGEAFERDGDYYGPMPNRAARLRGLAAGGETLVAESTAHLVRDTLPDGAQLVGLGARSLTGIARPEYVYRLVGAGSSASVRPTAHAAPAATTSLRIPTFLDDNDHFVARESQMRVLLDAWETVRHGASRTVFLAGEPGIGKTTLAARVARVAHEQGAVVLAGRCDEDTHAYQPFSELLRPLVREPTGRDVIVGLRGRLASELVRLVPELQDLGGAVEPPVETDAQTARHRLFDAFTTCIEAFSSRQPVVLVVEDLHWASHQTVHMLRFVARSSSGPLLIIGTYRDTEATTDPALNDALRALWRDPHFVHIELSGMTRDDVAALLESVAPGSTREDPGAAARLAEQTGGNPFFIWEVLHTAARPDGPTEVSGASSIGVRELVLRRLAQLSELGNRCLARASVIGTEFDDRLLAASDPVLDRADLVDALGEAVLARLIVENAEAPGRYRFAHAIVRDVIEASLAPGERARQHETVAEALEQIDPELIEEIANHYWSAIRLGAEAKVVHYARAAGRRATQRLAFDEAAAHFERAAFALDQLGALATTDGCDVLLDLARSYATAGDTQAAESAIARLVVIARKVDAPEYIAHGALCFEGEIVTGIAAWEQRLAVVEEAYSLVDRLDPALAARVLAMLVHVRAGLHPGPDYGELTERAINLAESAKDDVALTVALQSKLDVMLMPEHAEGRASLAASVLGRADAVGVTASSMSARHMRLAALLELGKLDEYESELSAYAAMAEALRRPHDLWRREVMWAGLHMFRGELERGSEMSRRAYAQGKRLQQPGALQGYFVHLFFAAWHRAELSAMVDAVVAAAAAARPVPAFRAALALTYAEVGQSTDAHALIGELVDDDFAAIPRDNLWLGALTFLAHAAWVSSNFTSARVLERALEPYVALNATLGSALALGSVARPLALAQALQGRFDDAAANLERAVVANAGMDSALWRATAQRDLAQVLLLRGRPEDALRAEQDAAEADEIAMQLGARRISLDVR